MGFNQNLHASYITPSDDLALKGQHMIEKTAEEKKIAGLEDSCRKKSVQLSTTQTELKHANQRIAGLETWLAQAKSEAHSNFLNFSQMKEICDAARRDKNDVYTERNRLVALLAGLYPAWKGKDQELAGTAFETVIYIKLPTGQISFHIPDKDLPLFSYIEEGSEEWDGHTTEEKFQRVQRLLDRRFAGELADSMWRSPAKLPDVGDIV
jgi:hypothetical protein